MPDKDEVQEVVDALWQVYDIRNERLGNTEVARRITQLAKGVMPGRSPLPTGVGCSYASDSTKQRCMGPAPTTWELSHKRMIVPGSYGDLRHQQN